MGRPERSFGYGGSSCSPEPPSAAFPWESVEGAGVGAALVDVEGVSNELFTLQLSPPLPQWCLLADPARPGHQLAGAALTAGTG